MARGYPALSGFHSTPSSPRGRGANRQRVLSIRPAGGAPVSCSQAEGRRALRLALLPAGNILSGPRDDVGTVQMTARMARSAGGRFSRARMVAATRDSSLPEAFAPFADSGNGRAGLLRYLLDFHSIQAGVQNPSALDRPLLFLRAPAHRRQLSKSFRRAFQGCRVSGHRPNTLIQSMTCRSSLPTPKAPTPSPTSHPANTHSPSK